jgi:molybdopterin-guanine dinucleotide biosynthesis protein A
MGQNKALMRLGCATLIERTLCQMRSVTTNLLLITNTPWLYRHLGLRMYTDLVPNMGALGGIYTGLTHADNPAVICVACDMPLLQPRLLSYLTTILGEDDAAVPYVENLDSSLPKFQTLSAVYSKKCLSVINQMFVEGELRVHALYNRISVRVVPPSEWRRFDPHGRSFFNINTPTDFENASRIIL